jgi:hypothetical protein
MDDVKLRELSKLYDERDVWWGKYGKMSQKIHDLERELGLFREILR